MLPEELNLDIHANLSTSNASRCNMFWPKKGERERDGMRGMVQEKMEKLLKAARSYQLCDVGFSFRRLELFQELLASS